MPKYLQKGPNPKVRDELSNLLLKMDDAKIKDLSFDIKTFDISGWMEKHNISTIYGLDTGEWRNIRRTKLMDEMINEKGKITL